MHSGSTRTVLHMTWGCWLDVKQLLELFALSSPPIQVGHQAEKVMFLLDVSPRNGPFESSCIVSESSYMRRPFRY